MRSHVLLVDDESLVLRGITRSVRDFCDVRAVQTAPEAMAAMREDQRWDAIVADIGLGSGSGLEVLDAARSLHPGVPLLAITGDTTSWRVNEAYRLGARVVAKPVRRWMLRALLDGEYREGVASLFACVLRYPGRWDDSLVAHAASKLESPAWRKLGPADWPDVLDAFDREIRHALPEMDEHRRASPVH